MIGAQTMYKWWILLNPPHPTDLMAPLLCRHTHVYIEGWFESAKERRHSLHYHKLSYFFMICLSFFLLLKIRLKGHHDFKNSSAKWLGFFFFLY